MFLYKYDFLHSFSTNLREISQQCFQYKNMDWRTNMYVWVGVCEYTRYLTGVNQYTIMFFSVAPETRASLYHLRDCLRGKHCVCARACAVLSSAFCLNII